MQQLIQATNDEVEKVDLYNKIADLYNNTDSLNTIIFVEKAVELADNINYKEGLADAYYILSWTYIRSSDYIEASEYAQKSLTISAESDYKNGMAKAYNGLGVIHRRLGDYKNALEYQFKSLEIRELLDDEPAIASTYNNIGFIYSVQNDYNEALEFYKRSLAIKEKYHLTDGLSYSYNNIGNIYYGIGEFENAIMYYEKALKISKELNDKRGLSSAYHNLGKNYLELSEYDTALYYLKQSYELGKEINNSSRISISAIYLGETYGVMGNYDLGEKYIKEGIAIARKTGDPHGVMYGTLRLARIYFETGRFREAYETHIEYNIVQDSLQNDELTKQLARITAEFEFQKEKDSLRILREKDQEIYEAELKRRNIQQIVTIAGLGVSVIFILLLYNSIVSKKKANNMLTELNKEVQNQNIEIKSQRDHLEETLEKLKRTQSSLLESEKMASLGILTAGVAHEINNPLNFIKGACLTLENHYRDHEDENIRSAITGLKEGVKRATSIVNGLNQFSRDSKMYNERCDIHAIIDNCLLMLNKQFSERIQVIKNYYEGAVIISGNSGKLHQVFLNILSNAEQAIATSGKITITTGYLEENAIIYISDTGEGIEKQFLNKIFDPFFTTKEPGKGTGLGLSISYTIIKEHAGVLSVDSEKNKGTTVRISLPVWKD